jgi:two-component sensor histidine kinase
MEIELDRFSFIDDPQATLTKLRQVADVECEGLNALLHFRDSHCLDIGPYLILAEVWPCLSPFLDGGQMRAPVQKVMEAVGLRRLMNMRLRAVRDLQDVWAFPIRRRTPQGAIRSSSRLTEPQRDQRVADEFCDAINRWLDVPEIGLELTKEGRAWISTVILELLDNAERHSIPATKDGGWSVAGFMARRREGEEWVYRCYIGILSVGATIDQSLETCSKRITSQVEEYVGQHVGRLGAPSRETLRTLFALQDGITRDPEADEHGRGGVGFQDVMSLINLLGNTDKPARDPRLTIISGRSCIMVRAPYIKGIHMDGPDSPRVLWFNPENSPAQPPSPTHVFDLQECLAGTIISLAFTLDPDYLNEIADE